MVQRTTGEDRGEEVPYPHGSFDDGDNIVRTVLVETRTALLVVKNDDGHVYGTKNAKLVGFFEKAVLPLEKG